jgi:hypothetical protein
VSLKHDRHGRSSDASGIFHAYRCFLFFSQDYWTWSSLFDGAGTSLYLPERTQIIALRMPASKCRIPWLDPWKHRVLQSFDEESNKFDIIEYSGMMRPSPRTLHRTTRLLLVLLVSGILIHSGLYLTADHWRQSPQANRVLSKSYIDARAKAQVDIDWSNYAYTQYVTDPTYLCNSLMIFESLHRLGSEADRLMMYPEQWSAESNTSEAGLLRKARHEYNKDDR